MSRPLHAWGPDSADRSLHTAGPDNPDCDIRLDLLGPAAVGSGPAGRRDADQSGMERVEGGGYGESNRAGSGRAGPVKLVLFIAIDHVPLGYRTAPRQPFIREALRVSGVRPDSDGRLDSSCSQHTCYTNAPSCLSIVSWRAVEQDARQPSESDDAIHVPCPLMVSHHLTGEGPCPGPPLTRHLCWWVAPCPGPPPLP
jgi:hypothetical protein